LTSGNSTNHPLPPILNHKHCDAPSVFVPENLLREARRQKALTEGQVPPVCILDPDGDIVRHVVSAFDAQLNSYWACYHTQLFNFEYEGLQYGIVGNAVGASFAVLVAEQLFVSGCELLISMTSSGQIHSLGEPPYFILIDRALRDEGTSYHYLPPSSYSEIQSSLIAPLEHAFDGLFPTVTRGSTWTTDAPFRETAKAVDFARSESILAVEMEAAALYAFAAAKRKPVICFAHVTNQMGQLNGDFEKGEAQGSVDALKVIHLTAGVIEKLTD
jgi:uridine phosphorylase